MVLKKDFRLFILFIFFIEMVYEADDDGDEIIVDFW